MTKLNFLISIFLIIFNQSVFSQINQNDLKFQFNTQKNAIEVLLIPNKSIVEGLKVKQINLDIFDKSGNYAGSMQLTDWKLNKDELAPDEKIKITSIQFIDIKTGKNYELKDIKLF